MGTSPSISIADALFSGVQKRVLALLFGQPERSYYANELEKLAKTGRGSLQRELQRLTASGLITVTAIGRQKHYQANKSSPIFGELRSITIKTFGLADVLRKALTPQAHAIRVAFIFGSVAKNTDTATSDIDLLVVADGMGYTQLFEVLSEAEQATGRKISPTLYSPAELQRKLATDNHFVTRILNQPKIFLIGNDDDLRPAEPRKPGEDRPTET